MAQADMLLSTHQLQQNLEHKPAFCLFFLSISRGPYFYDDIDRDLNVITKQLPNMPLLGFYGNGEIASNHGKNQLLTNAAVLSLFSEK